MFAKFVESSCARFWRWQTYLMFDNGIVLFAACNQHKWILIQILENKLCCFCCCRCRCCYQVYSRYENLNEKVLYEIFATIQLLNVRKPHRIRSFKMYIVHRQESFVLIENNEQKRDKHLFMNSICNGKAFGNFESAWKNDKAKIKEKNDFTPFVYEILLLFNVK